jgi:myo-inositol catabolism protein IolC
MAKDTNKTRMRDVYTISANHFARYDMNEVAVSADHNHDHLKVVVSGHKSQVEMMSEAAAIVSKRIAELQALAADMHMIMQTMQKGEK